MGADMTSTRRLGTFSYLPPFTQEEIVDQVGHILGGGLIPAIEHTTRPDPRDSFWSMWKLPLFDARSGPEVLAEIEACVQANPDSFVKLNGYDPKRQSQAASFVVHRPASAVTERDPGSG